MLISDELSEIVDIDIIDCGSPALDSDFSGWTEFSGHDLFYSHEYGRSSIWKWFTWAPHIYPAW